MSSEHPISVEVHSPARYERIQLLIRILLAMALGWVGVSAGWLVCTLFVLLPAFAAIAISSTGSERYLASVAPQLWRVLAWLLQLSAYMLMLTDRFPTGEAEPVQINARFTGTPTVGSALGRLLTSIPSGLVLVLLWFVSSILWLVGFVTVLFTQRVPESILAFQRGVLTWQSRLVAYHASVVCEYPPFAFESGSPTAPLPRASVARGR